MSICEHDTLFAKSRRDKYSANLRIYTALQCPSLYVWLFNLFAPQSLRCTHIKCSPEFNKDNHKCLFALLYFRIIFFPFVFFSFFCVLLTLFFILQCETLRLVFETYDILQQLLLVGWWVRSIIFKFLGHNNCHDYWHNSSTHKSVYSTTPVHVLSLCTLAYPESHVFSLLMYY